MFMFKIKKIDDNFAFDTDDVDYENNVFKKPLFHGTRMWLTKLSNEELTKMKEYFFKIICFYQNYYKNATKEEKDKINGFLNKIHTNTKYPCFDVGLITAPVGDYNLFEYGDIYFTASFSNAVSYSMSICGELGNFAYICSNVIRKLNITCDKEMDNIIDYVLDLYDKYHSDERIVLVLFECNIDDLRTESGGNDRDSLDYFLHANSASFRVKNIDKYDIYYISEEEFVKYIR